MCMWNAPEQVYMQLGPASTDPNHAIGRERKCGLVTENNSIEAETLFMHVGDINNCVMRLKTSVR